ncbi:MAG: ABC transporter ATP-binding protein [bacterium]
MLRVENLTIHFHTNAEPSVKGISFSVEKGECFGLVGESGSGKSATALAIAGLQDARNCAVTGRITLNGSTGFVFQEPAAAMDPLMRVGKQVEEPLLLRGEKNAALRREKALSALRLAQLPDPEAIYDKYPFHLSGGMLQRVMLASALVTEPSLLILDEPTTALDVTTQAEIVALLRRLNKETGLTMLFISHDLSLVRKLCPRAAVMRRGKIVEMGETEALFLSPREDYTRTLVASIPKGRRKA